MEETIKIQEEFENLIEQLERLKSINELSSSNAESAKKVIEHIDSFIKSTNAYKEIIENDYTLKSDKIEKLLSAFDKSIVQIDNKTKELTGSISTSFNDFKVETNKGLTANNKEIENAFISLNKSFETFKEDIKYSVEKSNNELKQNLTENQELSIQRLDQQDREIKILKTILFVICGLIVIGTIATIFLLK